MKGCVLIPTNRFTPTPVHARRVRGVRTRVHDGLTRQITAFGLGRLLVERGGHARAVVVLHNDAVRDIVVEGNLHTVLGVQAQPFPPVDTSATQVARGVAQARVFHIHPAVLPVGGTWRVLVGAFVGAVHSHLAIVHTRLASGHDALATGVTVRGVVLAHRQELARRAFAAGSGDVHQLGVDVDEWLGGVDPTATALQTDLHIAGVARFTRDGRCVELVVAGANGFGQYLLVLANVVIQAVRTHVCCERCACQLLMLY